MYIIVWEFRVKRGQEATFGRAYGPDGEWVRFFRRGAGYLSTELLRDERDERRYLTTDRWSSRAAFDAFRAAWQAEYRALDEAYESLTEQETLIGMFTVMAD
jgi:heme-degrading monooxygenase HmoA